MTIGRRLVDLLRSNLHSLFERTDSWDAGGHATRIETLSDEQLEAELRRRQARRAAAEAAANTDRGATPTVEQEAWREVDDVVGGHGRYRTTRRRRGRSHRGQRAPAGRDARLAQLYAQLECPYGADLATVRRHYRGLMRKYHPDVHHQNAEKHRLATELSQRLTSAYNELRRTLVAR